MPYGPEFSPVDAREEQLAGQFAAVYKAGMFAVLPTLEPWLSQQPPHVLELEFSGELISRTKRPIVYETLALKLRPDAGVGQVSHGRRQPSRSYVTTAGMLGSVLNPRDVRSTYMSRNKYGATVLCSLFGSEGPPDTVYDTAPSFVADINRYIAAGHCRGQSSQGVLDGTYKIKHIVIPSLSPDVRFTGTEPTEFLRKLLGYFEREIAQSDREIDSLLDNSGSTQPGHELVEQIGQATLHKEGCNGALMSLLEQSIKRKIKL